MTGRQVITIDGPAASGKSTVAQVVSERLGVPFVSSGLLYRAATLVAQGVVDGRPNAGALLAALKGLDVQLEARTDGNVVRLDGRDVTESLAQHRIDEQVSRVASMPEVRAWVDARLREIPGPFVIDGRDMGTAVFPDAAAKIYLTADPEVRAQRRVGERNEAFEQVVNAIIERDAKDAKQSAPAGDALEIDTSELTINQVVSRVMDHVQDASNHGVEPQ
jgi:cytidylate kinase